MPLTEAQIRADERQRIVNDLRAAAFRDDDPLVPPWALLVVAGMVADGLACSPVQVPPVPVL